MTITIFLLLAFSFFNVISPSMNMTMHGLGYPTDPLAEQWQVLNIISIFLINIISIFLINFMVMVFMTTLILISRAMTTLATWVTAPAVDTVS